MRDCRTLELRTGFVVSLKTRENILCGFRARASIVYGLGTLSKKSLSTEIYSYLGEGVDLLKNEAFVSDESKRFSVLASHLSGFAGRGKRGIQTSLELD
jgi:hypothetical protein